MMVVKRLWSLADLREVSNKIGKLYFLMRDLIYICGYMRPYKHVRAYLFMIYTHTKINDENAHSFTVSS